MKNLLSEGAKSLDISLNDVQLDNFIKYMDMLVEWNENVNLTAITEPKEVITKHFLDSLTALSLIPEKAMLADIGCGAGFPGLPLKYWLYAASIPSAPVLDASVNPIT